MSARGKTPELATSGVSNPRSELCTVYVSPGQARPYSHRLAVAQVMEGEWSGSLVPSGTTKKAQ